MGKKVVLMILDGWGLGDHTHADAIFETAPKYMNHLMNKWKWSTDRKSVV